MAEKYRPDDQETVPSLQAAGFDVSVVNWDSKAEWKAFDAVTVRSTWDYHQRLAPFMDVLREINQTTKLLNPWSALKWNSNKSYLRGFAQKGIPTIPTLWFDQFQNLSMNHIFETLSTDKIILKPLVGASAELTFPIEQKSGASFPSGLPLDEFFVQKFLPRIFDEGEFSMIYFNQKYSHCVLKTPTGGDYRVQEEYGGFFRSVEPPLELLDASKKVLQTVSEKLLYARIDWVRGHDDRFYLMELELIEPTLLFSKAPHGIPNFVDAVRSMV